MQRNRRVVFATAVSVMVSAGVVARAGGYVTSTAVGIRTAVGGVALARAPSSRGTRCGLHARSRKQSSSGVWTRGVSPGGSGGDGRRSRATAFPSSSIWSLPARQAGGSTTSTSTYASATAGRSAQVAEPGVVYFVSTPIGNLEDITLRAINVLRTADVIAAEDTRTTGSLLKLVGVERKGRLVSHHDHNTRRRVPEIVEAAREGKSVAVVSDAGTPGISDPGMELAAACAAEGVRVVPVPGACAAVAAVSVSGFASHEFVFFGFVSGKRGSAVRRRKLAEIAQEPRTCIMYESPHRIADTLRGLLAAASRSSSPRAIGSGTDDAGGRERDEEEEEDEDEEGSSGRGVSIGAGAGGESAAPTEAEIAAGKRPVVLARELTKLHEEIFRGTLSEAVARYGGDGSSGVGGTSTAASSGGGGGGGGKGGDGAKDPRGEFTVVLGPRAASSEEEGGVEGAARAKEALEARLVELTAGGMSTSSAVKMASKDLNLKKSDVYRVALSLQPSTRREGDD